MTDDDFIKAGLLAAADDYERQHVATAAAALDDSAAVPHHIWTTTASVDDLDASTIAHTPDMTARLSRAEGDLIAAWGELYQIPGFRLIEGETLSAAIRRALSEAANRKD